VFDGDLDAAPYTVIQEKLDGFHVEDLPMGGFGAPFDP
jgi:hypothetical protein